MDGETQAGGGRIVIDAHTRIVLADQVRLQQGKRHAPLDFHAGPVLVIDPATNRPVATITPVPGAPRPAPVAAATSTARSDAETASIGGGRMTDAQREGLERLIAENPKAPPTWIGEKFEAKYGRTIGIKTVVQYIEAHNAQRGK